MLVFADGTGEDKARADARCGDLSRVGLRGGHKALEFLAPVLDEDDDPYFPCLAASCFSRPRLAINWNFNP